MIIVFSITGRDNSISFRLSVSQVCKRRKARTQVSEVFIQFTGHLVVDLLVLCDSNCKDIIKSQLYNS